MITRQGVRRGKGDETSLPSSATRLCGSCRPSRSELHPRIVHQPSLGHGRVHIVRHSNDERTLAAAFDLADRHLRVGALRRVRRPRAEVGREAEFRQLARDGDALHPRLLRQGVAERGALRRRPATSDSGVASACLSPGVRRRPGCNDRGSCSARRRPASIACPHCFRSAERFGAPRPAASSRAASPRRDGAMTTLPRYVTLYTGHEAAPSKSFTSNERTTCPSGDFTSTAPSDRACPRQRGHGTQHQNIAPNLHPQFLSRDGRDAHAIGVS